MYQLWRVVLKPLLCLICGFISEEDILYQHVDNTDKSQLYIHLQHMKNLIHSDSYKHFCIPIGSGTDCHMRHVSFIMRRVYLSLFICINRSFAVFFFLICMCNPICLTWWGDMMFCIDLHQLRGWQQAWVQFKIWKIGRKSWICVCENTYGFLHVCVFYLIWFILC